MSHRRTDKRLHAPAVGLAAFCIALLLWGTGLLDAWEFKTWDFRARWLAQKGAGTDRVTLILLDQASLDWGKETNGWSWPWPREVYGAIVEFCRRAGARALGMDILFTEPSVYGVEDDLRLAESMAAFGRTAAAVFPGEGGGSLTRWPEGLRPPSFSVEGAAEKTSLVPGASLVSSRAAFPIPEIAAAAAVLAGVHLEPDSDGVYRRAAPIRFFDQKPLLPLGLACLLAETPAATVRMRDQALLVNGRPIPVDKRFEAILRFRPAVGAYEQYSAAAIIQSELRIQAGETPPVTPQALAGKYVLLGFSAPGLLDLRSSPVAGVYPGVQIHATLLDNYLSGDFIRRLPGWLGGVPALAVALGCAAAVSVTVGSLWIALWCAAGMVLPVGVSLALYHAGFWMPLVVCEIAAAGSIFFGLTLKYATEGRQKRFIRIAFTQYISPAVLDQLLQHPDKLRLGGERRLISIFFSDLQGFTSISEQLGPEELTGLLNEYLTAMTDIIIDEKGTVDKYEGDAIIAFWNAPVDVPDHAERAVRAALRCQEKLAELRPQFREKYGHDLHMRIGVNTGPAVVGNFGSQTKFNYTMLGDAVNLAARLEGINKPFGTGILVSEYTKAFLAEPFHLREIGRVAVVGRRGAVTVYEPMRHERFESRRALCEAFHVALAAFGAGHFSQAAGMFSALAEEDAPARAYVRKCRELSQDPPQTWEGIWVMASK